MTYPSGDQQNVVLSGGTAPVVAASTTTGAPAPASVVVLVYPSEIRQRPGTSGATAYFVQNVGDLPSQVTLSQQEGLLHAGSIVVHARRGRGPADHDIRQAAGVRRVQRTALIGGDGVPAGLGVRVSILVTDPPADVVIAKAGANRIDVAAPVTDAPTGTVQFTNAGPRRYRASSLQTWRGSSRRPG